MMLSHGHILITGIAIINVVAYTVMWFDKYQSKKKSTRIPENSIFLMALLFGAPGIYLGMKAPIYHKTSKLKFKIGIPFLIILNGVTLYFLFQLINDKS